MESQFDQVIYVGCNEMYTTLHVALTSVRKNVKTVLLLLTSDIAQSVDVDVPYNGSLLSLQIMSQGNKPVTIDFFSRMFFANGISLKIGPQIIFTDCFLFAGGRAVDGQTVSFSKGEIIINGTVDNVYGGGYSEGEMSVSSIQDSKIILENGCANTIFGGGYAVSAGKIEISGADVILVDDKSYVFNDVYGGSFLLGDQSESTMNRSIITVNGIVKNNIFCGSFVSFGAKSMISGIVELIVTGIFEGFLLLDQVCDPQSKAFVKKIDYSIPSRFLPKVAKSVSALQQTQSENATADKISSFSNKNSSSKTNSLNKRAKTKARAILSCCFIIFACFLLMLFLISYGRKKGSPSDDEITPIARENTALVVVPLINTIQSSETVTITSSIEVTKATDEPLIFKENSSMNTVALTTETSSESTQTTKNLKGIINSPNDVGTLLYSKAYMSTDLIMLTLFNGTHIEILDGPVFTNNFNWYNVQTESGLKGWVLINYVTIE